MAYGKEVQAVSVLNSILHEYKKISEAPSSFPKNIHYDVRMPECMTDEARQWIRDEQARRYKAQDVNGNVYLIMNPLVWPQRVVDGRFVIIRPKPELRFTSSQARDEAQNMSVQWQPQGRLDYLGAL